MNIRCILLFTLIFFTGCHSDEPENKETPPGNDADFYFGADLSVVNQILDHGGIYKESNTVKDPYQIFADKGANLVRARLWHNPQWTKDVYGAQGTQRYNDLADVTRTFAAAKAAGLELLLDLHYSDTWADPANQYVPDAWKNIRSIEVLRDSVYHYTFRTLVYLKNRNLQPELVQLGNEINCGLFFSDAPQGFPTCNVCNNEWTNAGIVLNAAIQAVRDVSVSSTVKTRIALHVADPKNVTWWFTNIRDQAKVTDFDLVGFSYYPLWHTTVSLDAISSSVSGFKTQFGKDVIVLETDYPWTTANADAYNNLFGDLQPLPGYPFSSQGQLDLMKKLTGEIMDGGGIGVIPWEPAYITSSMKDQWGTGSPLDNCAFFDFNGNSTVGMDYMTADYQ